MEIRELRVIRPDERRTQTTQTSGMVREEALSTDNAWVGVARTAAGVTSGWHHHGDYDSYVYVVTGRGRFDFGPGGGRTLEAEAEDFVVIPRHTIHREANPGEKESVIVLVRVGSGEPVFNVEGPDG